MSINKDDLKAAMKKVAKNGDDKTINEYADLIANAHSQANLAAVPDPGTCAGRCEIARDAAIVAANALPFPANIAAAAAAQAGYTACLKYCHS